MRESASARMAILAGGVSTQKPELRSPGQVEDADNIDFSLKHGAARRAGTAHLLALGASAPSSSWLICKALEGGQKPVVWLGSDGSVKVYDSNGSAATVVAKASATTYLASGSETTRPNVAGKTGDIGCLRIANPAVIPLAEASDEVTFTREHLDFETLVCHTGTTIGEVRRVLESNTADRPAALYRYEPGVVQASTATFDWARAAAILHATSGVNAAGQNPQGAKIWFPRFGINSAAASYDSVTRILTVVGGFTNYTFTAEDEAFVSGSSAGVGVGAGSYPIEKKIDADNIVLAVSPGAYTTLDLRGIGMEVEFKKDFTLSPPGTIDAYAQGLQQAIRDAGATNACVAWIPGDLDSTKTGQIVLTNHFSGALANFNSTAGMVVRAPSAGPYSLLTPDAAFEDTTPTIVNGDGDGTAKAPFDRWVVRPVNDQADAVPDPDTMPALVKPVQGFGENTTYYDATIALKPVAYWRLGERYGTGIFDSASDAKGIATNTPTTATGLLTGDTNPALTFAATESVEFATGIPNIARRGLLPEAVTFECLFKTTTSLSRMTAFCIKNVSGGAATQFQIDFNWNGSIVAAGHIRLFAKVTTDATSGQIILQTTSANPAIYDGNLHHLIVNSSGFWLDGVLVATTNTSPSGPFAASTTDAGYASISDATNPFLGTLDEVVLHDLTVTDAFAAWRNTRARGTNATALYMVGTEEWAPRTNGDSTTNPPPAFIRDGLPITAFTNWQSRLAIGAGRTFSASRAAEETAFYVKDVTVVTDAAPIDRIVTSADASAIDGLVTFGSICFAKTDGPTHYELSAAGALAIGTLNSRAGLNRILSTTLPVLAGERLYLLGPGDGAGGGRTLLEAVLNEQAVQASYDDVGQHIHGLIDTAGTATFELVAVPTDGKVLAVQIGSGNVYCYQTAYVGDEKRQSAWAPWDIGGTIKAACGVDGGVAMVVLRSTSYLLEFWEPQSPTAFPTASARMDGLVTLTGGSWGGANTTWTTPTNVPATGINRIVTAAGVEHTVTGTGSTVTLAGTNLNGQTVTAGRWFAATVELSRPFVRDQNGQAVISRSVTPAYAIVTASDVRKVRCLVTVDSRAEVDYPVTPLRHETTIGRAWTRGPSGRTSIVFSMPGVAPVSIGTIEQIFDSQGSRT